MKNMQKKNTLPTEITKIKAEIARDLGLSRATLYLWKKIEPNYIKSLCSTMA